MDYKTTIIDIGTIKQKTTKVVFFNLKYDSSEIEKIESICSCTVHRAQGKSLKVSYTPKSTKIPKLNIEKEICVMYKSGEIEFLVIKAIVIR